jgi:hypothetical protein
MSYTNQQGNKDVNRTLTIWTFADNNAFNGKLDMIKKMGDAETPIN